MVGVPKVLFGWTDSERYLLAQERDSLPSWVSLILPLQFDRMLSNQRFPDLTPSTPWVPRPHASRL